MGGIGLAALIALPVFRSVKLWRSDRLLANAEVALAQNDAPASRKAATAALNLNPSSLGALRAIAKSADDDAVVEALMLQEKLLQNSGPHPAAQDLRDYVRLCIELDFRASSVAALDLLVDQYGSETETWVVAGEYLLAGGNRATALDATERALELDPANIAARLLGCRITLWSSEPEIQNAAISKLLELGKRTDSTGLEALATLAIAPVALDAMTSETAAAGLRSHPQSNSDARLMAALIEFRAAAPDARQAIVERTIAAFAESDLMPLLGWLHMTQRHEEIIRLIPDEQALKSPGQFGALATALQLTGNDARLLKLFADHEGALPMNIYHRYLMEMHSHAQLGEVEAARRNWNLALRTARTQNPEVSLVLIAQWCENNGHLDEAIEAFEVLLEQHRDLVSHWYDTLVRLYRRTGNTPRLLQISRDLAGAYPENPVYQHNAAYLTILSEPEPLEAIRTLEAVTKQYPQIAGSRCAAALGYFRLGNAATAREPVASLDRESLTGLDQLIMDTVTGKSGSSGASSSPGTLPGDLLPEERALFGLQ